MKLEEAASLIQTEEIKHEFPETWADLGCGSGLFTHALSTFLADQSLIYAVDNNLSSFRMNTIRDQVVIKKVLSNFETDSMNLTNLDGILMANSLHYIKNKKAFLEKAKTWYGNKPVFLIVEYDRDHSNPWVPYPISFQKLKELFTLTGFTEIKKLHEKKSFYGGGKMYSALIR